MVYRDGFAPRLECLDLDRLFSPKSFVHRRDRRTDFDVLIELYRTPLGRAKIAPIGVEPIEMERASRFTPIREVLLLEGVPSHELP